MDRARVEVSHNVDERHVPKPRLRERKRAWLVALAALGLAIWAANWAIQRWTHIYVDDARIDGEVVTIASRVSGWITDLPVIEGDEVKAGQVIARIDNRDAMLQRDVLLARLKAV